MNNVLFFSAGHTEALKYATKILKKQGFHFTDRPSDAVTHLLLPVPSFEPDGRIKGGGELITLLEKLPSDVIVVGGNLNRQELQTYTTIDLLQDPHYVAQNACITAHCAIKLAMNKLPITLDQSPVLVIGWGRIGKCLADLLKKLGADVTVATRKEETRAILSALGCKAVDTAEIDANLYRVIFNTAPVMVCPQCDGHGLKIDLASQPGIGGLDVVWARGLPNKDAPESSGTLIAKRVMDFTCGKEN